MTTQTVTTTTSPYQTAGRSAIASGIVGILAVGFLIAYLAFRNQTFEFGILMQRFHDVGVSFQFLLLIPAVRALYKLSQQGSTSLGRPTIAIGVGALSFTALCLWLIIPKVVSDGLYIFPQGVFGVWLIIANWRLTGLLSKSLRWFGMVVGLGLLLVGMFFVGYAIFVSTILLRIPAAPLDEISQIPITTANVVLHYFIWIGSLLGVLTLPFWTILLGRRLLHERN